MAFTFDDLQRAYDFLSKQGGIPATAEIVSFAALLKQSSFQYEASYPGKTILPKNIEKVVEALPLLRFGDANAELNNELNKARANFSLCWATRSTLNDFTRRLAEITGPLEQDEDRLNHMEGDLELQRVRLKTLQKLADLLDDLLEGRI